ncbi:unnamed protein product [Cylicocyclus nassatus]|uniref:Hamartin n=1 Tax=Cylicocyclus nassatus TaxID=53992 RepID=A0AA36MGU6_CYLNA|nr:unnamed protein product [Cylicocyclus nassatus]
MASKTIIGGSMIEKSEHDLVMSADDSKVHNEKNGKGWNKKQLVASVCQQLFAVSHCIAKMSRVSDDARQALSLQINLGNGIYQLVHYYGRTHSNRALDLLSKIKEPHDKTFLDSLSDTIKEKKIMATLDLLGQIVQTAPSWTPKIALHPVFKAILQHIVITKELDECIGALLFVTALLPHCSSLPLDVLNTIFHAFIEGCHTYRMKWLMLDSRRISDVWDRVDVGHLAFALREFFHAVYGVYPTNFISYLRNYFVDKNGGNKRRDIATYVICPLLAGVRLHPNLILVGKDKELSKERWHQRESHDFLDDCRRIVIGKIPLNAVSDCFDISSESESPPAAPQEVFPQLFASHTSSSSSDYAWRAEDSDNDLLNALSTPPGGSTRNSTQKRNVAEEEWAPIVITDEKRHRSVDAPTRSLRNSIGSFFKRDLGSDKGSIGSHGDRVVEYAISSSTSHDNVQAEEAEEAVECLTPVSRQSPERMGHAKPRVDPQNEGLRIAQAAQAVALAVRREHHSGQDTTDVTARSRSASFLFDSPHVEDREKSSMQEREKSDVGTERGKSDAENAPNNGNGEGTRNRFSIGSFFTKLNRQRFASECHPVFQAATTHHSCHPIKTMLNRTSSCPDFLGEKRTPVGAILAEVAVKAPQEDLLERFPYLRLVRPLGAEHYAEVEANLESEHEVRRTAYMEKSKEFHYCLREMGLADRLPGRIYDDMIHITAGLQMEKQRDILRARLRLVNQHLLYERSCRLLHANRNRRLFGRIKQQKVTEAEMEQLKENFHAVNSERKELITALSGIRRFLDDEKRNRSTAETEAAERMKEWESVCSKLNETLQEVQFRSNLLEQDAKNWKSQIDQYRRRADDAEEQVRLLRQQLPPVESLMAELIKTQSVNQQLRDQIRMLESRSEEGAPYLRLLPRNGRKERGLVQDMERVQTDLINEHNTAEEYRARAQDWEHMCKTESVRSAELKGLLDRATNLLREQKDAAEQKFLSLQAVVRRQEEHIFDLYRRLEERDDALRRAKASGSHSSEHFRPSRVPSEIRSFDSSLSDIYVPRDVICGLSPSELRSSEEEVGIDLEETV